MSFARPNLVQSPIRFDIKRRSSDVIVMVNSAWLIGLDEANYTWWQLAGCFAMKWADPVGFLDNVYKNVKGFSDSSKQKSFRWCSMFVQKAQHFVWHHLKWLEKKRLIITAGQVNPQNDSLVTKLSVQSWCFGCPGRSISASRIIKVLPFLILHHLHDCQQATWGVTSWPWFFAIYTYTGDSTTHYCHVEDP